MLTNQLLETNKLLINGKFKTSQKENVIQQSGHD